ncbi:MAG: hypothetical protein ACR2IV_17320 [Bryobacteraceae bacterium]
MGEATSWSEIPIPQKALTKLTKGVFRGTFVSFVSAFPHPQISKTDALPPRLPAQLSLTVNISRTVNLASGKRFTLPTLFVNARASLPQMTEELGLA